MNELLLREYCNLVPVFSSVLDLMSLSESTVEYRFFEPRSKTEFGAENREFQKSEVTI